MTQAQDSVTELRSAVIGVGLAGENHLRALTALGLPVAGVLANRPERTAEAARRWRVRGYDDLDQLLADAEATLVHVCTPPSSHRPLVEAALGAGCAVLCEKPLATTRAEARALADRAATHPATTRVGFNRRFDLMLIGERYPSAGACARGRTVFHVPKPADPPSTYISAYVST